MTHDPVCTCSGICDPPRDSCSELGQGGCGCECSGIAKGRADERQKATGGLIDRETAARIAANALTAGCVMPRVITEISSVAEISVNESAAPGEV